MNNIQQLINHKAEQSIAQLIELRQQYEAQKITIQKADPSELSLADLQDFRQQYVVSNRQLNKTLTECLALSISYYFHEHPTALLFVDIDINNKAKIVRVDGVFVRDSIDKLINHTDPNTRLDSLNIQHLHKLLKDYPSVDRPNIFHIENLLTPLHSSLCKKDSQREALHNLLTIEDFNIYAHAQKLHEPIIKQIHAFGKPELNTLLTHIFSVDALAVSNQLEQLLLQQKFQDPPEPKRTKFL